jgi:hypothetical protein
MHHFPILARSSAYAAAKPVKSTYMSLDPSGQVQNLARATNAVCIRLTADVAIPADDTPPSSGIVYAFRSLSNLMEGRSPGKS